MVYEDYTWIFAVATVFSFISAFGIGANDVANSFSSSVGSKAITITQAVLIASICEFAGAVGLGGGVTSTIKSGVANVKAFTDVPDLLMWGMTCALISTAFWDNLACHLELPVSTTHTVVGAIVGMSMTLRGSDAVVWSKKTDEFPYYSGMSAIFTSWISSPLMSGIGVFIIFGFIRTVILRSEHSFDRGYYLLPAFSFLTFFIITLFIIQTGNKQDSWDQVEDGKAVWISVVVAFPLSILTLLVVMPIIRKWVLEEEATRERKDAEEKGEVKGLAELEHIKPPTWWENTCQSFENFAESNVVGRILFRNPLSKALSAGMNEDVHESVRNDESVGGVWDHAEVFDWKTEALFRYLQVFSAMTMSFAHGANDVANAIGPYAAVYYVWRNKKVAPSKSPVPKWIYAFGATGLVIGLATFGHHIIRVLGVKVAKLTNARGFCAEISTATVVLVASRYGLPVSTTQIITGAVLAIGLFEGIKGVNWPVVFRTFFGWVITILISALVSAGFTAFGAMAPNKLSSDETVTIRKIILKEIVDMRAQIAAATGDMLDNITDSFNEFNKTQAGYIYPHELVELQKEVLGYYNNTFALA